MFTGDALDCEPCPGRTSPTLGWSVIAVKTSQGEEGSAGLCHDQIFDENTSKWTSKWNFLAYCLKLDKIPRMFPQEYIYFFNPIHKSFVGNLMSEFTRALTLTSPSTIRVNRGKNHAKLEILNLCCSLWIDSIGYSGNSKSLMQPFIHSFIHFITAPVTVGLGFR